MRCKYKYSTMGEYLKISLSLMSNIRDTNKLNVHTLIIKQQDTDRIEKKIEQLELQLKNYSSEEQYTRHTLDTWIYNLIYSLKTRFWKYSNKKWITISCCYYRVKPGVERYMNYLTLKNKHNKWEKSDIKHWKVISKIIDCYSTVKDSNSNIGVKVALR